MRGRHNTCFPIVPSGKMNADHHGRLIKRSLHYRFRHHHSFLSWLLRTTKWTRVNKRIQTLLSQLEIASQYFASIQRIRKDRPSAQAYVTPSSFEHEQSPYLARVKRYPHHHPDAARNPRKKSISSVESLEFPKSYAERKHNQAPKKRKAEDQGSTTPIKETR